MSPVPVMGMGSMGMAPGASGGAGQGSSAKVKFCNAVRADKGPVTMKLTIGDVQLEAASGACDLASMCSSVPAGTAHLVFSLDGREVYAQDIAIEADQQYVVFATVDKVSQKIGLGGGKLPLGLECAKQDPFRGIDTSGMAPGGPGGDSLPPASMTALKFCNHLPVAAGGGNEAELQLGDTLSLKAAAGQCTPMKGAACALIAAGDTMATLLVDGQPEGGGNVTFAGGKAFSLTLSVDAAGNGGIKVSAIPAGMTCSSYEPN